MEIVWKRCRYLTGCLVIWNCSFDWCSEIERWKRSFRSRLDTCANSIVHKARLNKTDSSKYQQDRYRLFCNICYLKRSADDTPIFRNTQFFQQYLQRTFHPDTGTSWGMLISKYEIVETVVILFRVQVYKYNWRMKCNAIQICNLILHTYQSLIAYF